jgi:hypothetical protein
MSRRCVGGEAGITRLREGGDIHAAILIAALLQNLT